MSLIKAVFGINSLQEFGLLEKIELSTARAEFLLGHRELSRFGKWDTDALIHAAKTLKEKGHRAILDWDILMDEDVLKRASQFIQSIDLRVFSAVRVQDVGAYQFISSKYPDLPIQFILETGNHNIKGIQYYSKLKNVERVVVSIEIPKVQLEKVIQESAVPVEVLGLGPILLLYTPRHLLSQTPISSIQNKSWFEMQSSQHEIKAIANTEEPGSAGHSGLRVLENMHGTFLIHSRDYSLVPKFHELQSLSLGAFRFDYRSGIELNETKEFGELIQSFAKLFESSENSIHAISAIEKTYEKLNRKTLHCFYQTNATDVLFKKLKNTKILRTDYMFVGEVLEMEKGSHCLVDVQVQDKTIKIGDVLKFITPEGKVRIEKLEKIKNIDGQEIHEAKKGELVVVPYMKYVAPRTMVYFAASEEISNAESLV